MAQEQTVRIAVGPIVLEGTLGLPEHARGVVLFAHGSGSSRFSPRNRHVAEVLRGAGLGTLLLDLLTPDEEAIDVQTRHLRFDIALLTERLIGAVDWLRSEPATRDLAIGAFGASTGAAAALVAAARRREEIRAVVSRGGRPDLAGPALDEVVAPTLLIVGGRDEPVIELNRQAMARLHGITQLTIVEGATHLFEEHGTLDVVADLARAWFTRYLPPPRTLPVAGRGRS